MLIEEIKKLTASRKELRKFGLLIGIVLMVLGCILFWTRRESYLYFMLLGLTFILSGLIVPVILRPIYKLWMTFALILGWLMTKVILSILFFLVFTPFGLVARLLGKDFLDRKIYHDASSYWQIRERFEKEENRWERQF